MSANVYVPYFSFYRVISQSCVTPTLLPDLKFFDLVFGRTLGSIFISIYMLTLT